MPSFDRKIRKSTMMNLHATVVKLYINMMGKIGF